MRQLLCLVLVLLGASFGALGQGNLTFYNPSPSDSDSIFIGVADTSGDAYQIALNGSFAINLSPGQSASYSWQDLENAALSNGQQSNPSMPWSAPFDFQIDWQDNTAGTVDTFDFTVSGTIAGDWSSGSLAQPDALANTPAGSAYQDTSGSFGVATVPEPSGPFLLALGLLMASFLVRPLRVMFLRLLNRESVLCGRFLGRCSLLAVSWLLSALKILLRLEIARMRRNGRVMKNGSTFIGSVNGSSGNALIVGVKCACKCFAGLVVGFEFLSSISFRFSAWAGRVYGASPVTCAAGGGSCVSVMSTLRKWCLLMLFGFLAVFGVTSEASAQVTNDITALYTGVQGNFNSAFGVSLAIIAALLIVGAIMAAFRAKKHVG